GAPQLRPSPINYAHCNNRLLRRSVEYGQFRSRKYQRAIKAHGLLGSMGRVGAAGDNAAMESFFSTLQKNVLNKRRWSSRDELRREIVYWIERTYHRRRRQRRLGKLTPVEYETVYRTTVALAA
ncbi:integrase core domain-containing protein, partial [Nesterenkonia sp. E16_10]|uniref:integrase core domain-containing protein n=1 Tax=Nesterenkonia sp. E16_10 TaxID=2789296 RepID=UPI001A916B6F